MKQVLWCLIIAIGVLPTAWLMGQDEAPEIKPSKVMQRKLDVSEKILPALAKEDYAQLSRSADQLLKIAKEQWIANDTPEYQAQLKDFWVVVEGIKTSAEEKNLDEATLGYVQMTISCVKCHKSLRKRAE